MGTEETRTSENELTAGALSRMHDQPILRPGIPALMRPECSAEASVPGYLLPALDGECCFAPASASARLK